MKDQLIAYIREHDRLLGDLKLVRELELPDCYIAAGYLRNYVWDRLHGFVSRGMHTDIDVVFFDTADVSEARDRLLERQLIAETGNGKWSVKNQARMHINNGATPYRSTEDAIRRWPETATAVAARMDRLGAIVVLCPHGLDDLFSMTVRRNPLFADHDYYLERLRQKNWQAQWPLLHVITEA